MLQGAAKVSRSNPEAVESLFATLGKIEGAAINLRGALFHIVVGHIVHRQDGGFPDLSKTIREPGSGDRAEIDVLSVREGQVTRAVECKGYSPRQVVELTEVERWVTKKVPIMMKWLRAQSFHNSPKLVFEVWTSSSFSEAAVEYLKARKDHTKRYRIRWRQGHAVLEEARAAGATAMGGILRDYYLREPLAAALSSLEVDAPF